MTSVVVIKVKKENSLVLTNISFGRGIALSIISIDETSIALNTCNGIEVYNKASQELTHMI